MSVFDQLDQDETWTDGSGRTWPLGEMKERHRRNVLLWLVRNAEALQEAEQFAMISGPMPSGDAACDAFDSAMGEAIGQEADEWLEEQPLVMRLRQLTGETATSGAQGTYLQQCVDLLGQDEVWPRDGQMVPLADLTPDHRANVMAWLDRNARRLSVEEFATTRLGGSAAFGLAMGLGADEMPDPTEWLLDQPLVVRLTELVEQDRERAS